MADNLKSLPPEERIKRLKELEEKKKREIEEQRKAIDDAEKGIKEANEELTERQKVKDKVPIAEVASEQGEGLSEEAKIILKSMQKRVGGRKDGEEKEKGQEEGGKGKAKEKDEGQREERPAGFSRSGLEETVQQERTQMEKQGSGGAVGRWGGADYITSLSQQPAAQLYQQMSALYQTVETKGYMNAEEQRRVQYISSAMEKKLEDVGAGKYSLTEEAARATSLTQQMSEVVRGMYKPGKEKKELDWYKSG